MTEIKKDLLEINPNDPTPEEVTKAWELVRQDLINTIEKLEPTSDSMNVVLGVGEKTPEQEKEWLEIVNFKSKSFTQIMQHLLKHSPSLAIYVMLSFQCFYQKGIFRGKDSAMEQIMQDMLGSSLRAVIRRD
jgi:hypothetical protein